MNDLRDTRQHVGRTSTDQAGSKGHYALAASEAVFELLSGNPNVELATLRFRVDAELPPKVTVTGRVGSLVGEAGDPGELTFVRVVMSECASCHQLTGRPPTEYCQTRDVHELLLAGGTVTPVNRPRVTRCKQDGGVLCSTSIDCECKQ